VLGQVRMRPVRQRVAARAARTTKGWGAKSPARVSKRLDLYRGCGSSAFLLPNSRRPEQSKFPVMQKCARTCSCTYDCRGVRSAMSRAAQHGYRDVERKALALGRKLGCSWAV